MRFLPRYISDNPQKDAESANKGCSAQTIEGLYVVVFCGYILSWHRIIFFAKKIQNIFLWLWGETVLSFLLWTRAKQVSVFGLADIYPSGSFYLFNLPLTCLFKFFWGSLPCLTAVSAAQQCCSAQPRYGQRRLPWQFTADESDSLSRQLPSAPTGKGWVKTRALNLQSLQGWSHHA